MTFDSLYLDHAATTPLLPVARDAMLEGFALWANPSSPHRAGRAARAADRNGNRIRCVRREACNAEPARTATAADAYSGRLTFSRALDSASRASCCLAYTFSHARPALLVYP